MDTARLIFAVVATVLAAGGAVLVLRTELRLDGRPPVRRVVEVVAPVVGLVVLVVAVWAAL